LHLANDWLAGEYRRAAALIDADAAAAGGQTITRETPQAAGTMLQAAGFSGADMVVLPAGTVMVARR
jgi:hypothetical protein